MFKPIKDKNNYWIVVKLTNGDCIPHLEYGQFKNSCNPITICSKLNKDTEISDSKPINFTLYGNKNEHNN